MSKLRLCVKKHVDKKVFFIAKTFGIPPLIVREGKIEYYQDHHYYINSGGQSYKRHEEQIWKDEDFAWKILNAAFPSWMQIYNE